MLRLVCSGGRPTLPHNHRVLLVELDLELAHYVAGRLLSHWPAWTTKSLDGAASLGAEGADLVVCGGEPTADCVLPTLWLSGIEQRCRPFRVRNNLWKCATPITGQRLVRVVAHMLELPV